MIPSANTENCSSAPPVKRFRSPNSEPAPREAFAKKSAIAEAFTPGTGTAHPTR